MREFERRIRKLEEVGPAQRSDRFAISDYPEDGPSDDNQIRHSMDGGRVVYLLKEREMLNREWTDRYCTPD
jgi:hypothetical protein